MENIKKRIDTLTLKKLELEQDLMLENSKPYESYKIALNSYDVEYNLKTFANTRIIKGFEQQLKLLEVEIRNLKIDFLYEEKINEINSIKNRINV